MIYNITAGFLKAYVQMQSNKQITPEEMFKSLSYEMGGDGKSISKSQLDSYIDKLESSSSKDNVKLKALKTMQKNWDTMSGGKDSITFEDLKSYTLLLAQAFSGDDASAKEELDEESKYSIKSLVHDSLMEKLKLMGRDKAEKTDFNEYLNDVLASPLDDEDLNNEIVAQLTNIIESYSSNFSVEKEA